MRACIPALQRPNTVAAVRRPFQDKSRFRGRSQMLGVVDQAMVDSVEGQFEAVTHA
jgi:hypothetical protein